jgi:uncharacterized protein
LTAKKMPEGGAFIVELPPRRDTEAVVEKHWDPDLSGGVTFEGQHFCFPEGLSVDAALQWMEESLLSVRLSLQGLLKGECARCLGDASLAISDDLRYLYYLRGTVLGKDTHLQSDDGFLPVEMDAWGRTINLADQVWESLWVLLPRKLLCREDCAGLCQNCGANLNEGACSCAPQRDVRFDALRDFVADNEDVMM